MLLFQRNKHNDGEIDVDWYDVVGISSIQIEHEFLFESISTVDVLFREDFDPIIETAQVDDGTIQVRNVAMNNIDKLISMLQ